MASKQSYGSPVPVQAKPVSMLAAMGGCISLLVTVAVAAAFVVFVYGLLQVIH